MECGSEDRTGYFYLSPKFSVTLQSPFNTRQSELFVTVICDCFSIVHVLECEPRGALGSREGLAPPEDSIFSHWINGWTPYPPDRNPCTNTNSLHPVTDLPDLAPELERSVVMDTFENLMEATEHIPCPRCEQNFAEYFRDFTDHPECKVKNFWSLIQSSSSTNVPRKQKWLAQDHMAAKKKKKRWGGGNLFWAVNDQNFLVFPDPSFALGRDSQHIHLELDFSISRSFV